MPNENNKFDEPKMADGANKPSEIKNPDEGKMSKKTLGIIIAVVAVIVIAVVAWCIAGQGASGGAEDSAAQSTAATESSSGSTGTDGVEVQLGTVEIEGAEEVEEESDSEGTQQKLTTGSATSVTAITADEAIRLGTSLTWEAFYAMDPEDKDAYLESYDSYDDFYDWMVAAQAQFKIDHPDVEIGSDGTIDLSKL